MDNSDCDFRQRGINVKTSPQRAFRRDGSQRANCSRSSRTIARPMWTARVQNSSSARVLWTALDVTWRQCDDVIVWRRSVGVTDVAWWSGDVTAASLMKWTRDRSRLLLPYARYVFYKWDQMTRAWFSTSARFCVSARPIDGIENVMFSGCPSVCACVCTYNHAWAEALSDRLCCRLLILAMLTAKRI